jgi:hypothetical protein
MPSGCFPSAEVDAHGAKGCGTGLLRGTAEYITTPGDFKVVKPGRQDNRFKLCVQQSASNSARPQINLSLCFFRDGLLNQDISDLYSSAWPQHPVHFAEDC